ncbi:cytokine receptor common subunit gamma-like isoform X2 [Narcine bancroftii]|uniref:cytokine receptor common subunit gamma-like isoform X2 n=1 Tax=Narcine bancroftii TaxID=1343680 RepID=UPI0038321CEF
MDLILACNVITIVIVQHVGSSPTREGKAVAGGPMECIYHNKEYVNCTWKATEEAAHGVSDRFYYWFAKMMHKSWCRVTEGKQRCKLKRRNTRAKWMCLYINASNNVIAKPMNCYKLQDQGPQRLMLSERSQFYLDCLFPDDKYLDCSWDQGKDAREDVRYIIRYVFSENMCVKQCKHYLQDGNGNVGCHLTVDNEIAKIKYLFASVLDNNNVTRISPQRFLLHDQVKMNPPQNLAAKLIGKEDLLLNWSMGSHNSKLFQYQIEYKSNLDLEWQRKLITYVPFTLSNIDPAKCYFFRLRCNVRANIAQTSHWSDWGPTLIWKGKTRIDSCPLPEIKALFLVSLLGAIPVFAVFVCVLFKVKRLRALAFPGIPDPKRIFVDLFDDHNGNFQLNVKLKRKQLW